MTSYAHTSSARPERAAATVVRLVRTVRCSVGGSTEPDPRWRNGGGGWPRSSGLSRYYELDVACRGEPDPRTSYLADVKAIDEAVRAGAIPFLDRACRERPDAEPVSLLPELIGEITGRSPVTLESLRWWVTPQHAVAMEVSDMSTALMSQRFEFAASHRLHNPEMSDEENRRVYGKCNHPGGHGHNYVIEPVVEVSLNASSEPFGLGALERIVDQTVLHRFDHKHLNDDTTEFGADGVNPSVENIARVCYELLAPDIQRAGAKLREVTVWETERTRAIYPA